MHGTSGKIIRHIRHQSYNPGRPCRPNKEALLKILTFRFVLIQTLSKWEGKNGHGHVDVGEIRTHDCAIANVLHPHAHLHAWGAQLDTAGLWTKKTCWGDALIFRLQRVRRMEGIYKKSAHLKDAGDKAFPTAAGPLSISHSA